MYHKGSKLKKVLLIIFKSLYAFKISEILSSFNYSIEFPQCKLLNLLKLTVIVTKVYKVETF